MKINEVLGYITGDSIVVRYYPSFKEWQVTKETCRARCVPVGDARLQARKVRRKCTSVRLKWDFLSRRLS